MGYPGDQGKPGDWPPAPSPHAPYGPGAERPEAAPYGTDNGETPFAPRGEDVGGPSPSGTNPFSEPAGSAWADEPIAGPAFQAGPPGPGPAPEEAPYGIPMDAGFDGTPPGPSGGGPTPPGKRRNLPLVIGGAVAAGLLLIGGGVGLSAVLKDDSKPKKAAAPSPSTPAPQTKVRPSVPPLEPVKLKSRATDPTALTLTEVFRKPSFKDGKQKYVRTAVNAKKGCTGVVGGTALTKALKKGGCAQALRATYALGTGKLIGTVGVLNLKTEAAAKQAAKAAGSKDAFLQALPGKGITKTNGKGEALGTSEVFGHYVIMTWVQRPDGKKIETKYHNAVRGFGTQLVKGSGLSLALHYRETEGKPLQK